MTDRYAVFGNPIAHSKSPRIHTLFAEQTKQDIEYTKQLVELGQFAQTAQTFFEEGGKGLNVTVPFKLDAYEFSEKHGVVSERARFTGALNTLKKMPDGKIFGDNTDGAGLVRDITQNLGWEIKGKRILILGAGGAVRGVMAHLLAERPTEIIIANRTKSKAEELRNIFSVLAGVGLSKILVWDITDQRTNNNLGEFDLVINGTSAGLQDEEKRVPDGLLCLTKNNLNCNTCFYDMTYGVKGFIGNTTPFLFAVWDKIFKRDSNIVLPHNNLLMADGLGMLVEQAAESFYIWRGVKPETKSVIEKIRSEL